MRCVKVKKFKSGSCIYKNELKCVDDIRDWIAEGYVNVDFNKNGLVLSSELDAELCGDSAHFVFWCPKDFPDEVVFQWDFKPLTDEGLCMFFFSAKGKNEESIFSNTLPKRHGIYPEYHSGAINALHLSYYRRKHASERVFNTCNLRKSAGFYLVSQGADPIPSVKDVIRPYQMKLIKYKEYVQFYIDDLPVLIWEDKGEKYGPILEGGKIGFRQMAPMKGQYSNFKVYEAIQEK